MQELEFGTASTFKLMWNDGGSGADANGAFYRPLPEAGFFIIGDYGQNNYGYPRGTVITVRENDRDEAHPLLKPPVDYAEIWTDRGSGADRDGSFWQPIPPPGYIALGCVCQEGYTKPELSKKYRCLRVDHVQFGSISDLIWADHGSGADGDLSVFGIVATNVLYAQSNYGEPNRAGIHIPKGLTTSAK